MEYLRGGGGGVLGGDGKSSGAEESGGAKNLGKLIPIVFNFMDNLLSLFDFINQKPVLNYVYKMVFQRGSWNGKSKYTAKIKIIHRPFGHI